MMCDAKKAIYLQNRELSWLMFNRRVMAEAEDPTVPLLERLKFISIFTSNLDEFFMVRVGSLRELALLKEQPIDSKTSMTAQEQLKGIYKRMDILYRERDCIYKQTEKLLRQYGIANLAMSELTAEEELYAEEYFEKMIRPLLSPQIIDMHHPFPHIANKVLHVAVRLKRGKKELLGMIPTVSSLPRIIKLPKSEMRYLLLETVLLNYADAVFDHYDVLERTVFCVTRSADINIDDDIFDVDSTYLMHVKRVLRERSRLAPVRLELGHEISNELLNNLLRRLQLKKECVWISHAPLEMSYAMRLGDLIPSAIKEKLTYIPFVPQAPDFYRKTKSIIAEIEARDRLLFYPYQTFDVFTHLMQEAACDPDVISIKITVYRLAGGASKLTTYLIGAAEAGKDVTVLMELKARFDEQNNIDWAERLEAAGCRVLYGFEGFKVHSKICLITRCQRGRLQYITQIGTGNYNEKTAKIYTDISLLTTDVRIGRDAALFFQNMGVGNLDGTYEHLLVAPKELRSRLLARIDREIARAQDGFGGRIIFKMNSLTDKVVIEKLCEASAVGVRIDLIVRGICCLLPNVKGKTENITVRSIVGRFLEHSRIYLFGEGADTDIYLSSADMMTRNTERRVEIACPVWDEKCKERIIEMLSWMLQDNAKARILKEDGTYEKITDANACIDSQAMFINLAKNESEESTHQPNTSRQEGFWKHIWNKFKSRQEKIYKTSLK